MKPLSETGKFFTSQTCLPIFTTGYYCYKEKSNLRTMRRFNFGFYSYLLLIFIALLVPCNGNEHDSLQCEETGNCPDSIHTVIRLAKRDDELARRIARDYGLILKVDIFLGYSETSL